MSSEEHRLALPSGYRLEEFQINRVLGKGGFGITYLADDLHLQQEVAIKEHLPDGISTRVDGSIVVAQSVPQEEDYSWSLESFVTEARTLARIQHPNVVKVTRLIEANGTAYMVMEYLKGESLNDFFRRAEHALTEDALLEIVLPVLDGLAVVHKMGLLHRDIKPDNIYLTEDGRPILLDFGAARQVLGQKTVTMTSMVSHGYSPFEQYQTKARQSAGTDIYALGGVLYRAITGEKPPVASDRVFRDELESVSQRAGGHYSTAFLTAIDRALAVDLEERPDSVGSWRRELLGEAQGPAEGSGSKNPSEPSEPNEASELGASVEVVSDRGLEVIEVSESGKRSGTQRVLFSLLGVGLVALAVVLLWPSDKDKTSGKTPTGPVDPGKEIGSDPKVPRPGTSVLSREDLYGQIRLITRRWRAAELSADEAALLETTIAEWEASGLSHLVPTAKASLIRHNNDILRGRDLIVEALTDIAKASAQDHGLVQEVFEEAIAAAAKNHSPDTEALIVKLSALFPVTDAKSGDEDYFLEFWKNSFPE